MIARVVDVILRRSPIIQGGLEIEVEVAAAANEDNICFKKGTKTPLRAQIFGQPAELYNSEPRGEF